MAGVAFVCCSSPPAVLHPAEEALEVGGDRAVLRVADLYLEVESRAWVGTSRVLAAATPIKLTLENRGERPLAIRYEDFTLETWEGRRLRVRRPHEFVEERGGVPVLVVDRERGLRARFRSSGFSVSSRYAELFPELETSRYGLGYSAAAATRYAHYWRKPLPTRRMKELGFPEGTLMPGGRLEGFLFFEPVPASTNYVALGIVATDAETEAPLGRGRIPFQVSRSR